MTELEAAVALATAFLGVLTTWIRVWGVVQIHKITQQKQREIVTGAPDDARVVWADGSLSSIETGRPPSRSAEGTPNA